jgi:hypothetical protein
VVVVVNGAKGRLSGLLRRGLLVAAMAGVGWLLSVGFSAAAAADELPGDDSSNYRTQSGGGGLLGGLLGGVTSTLTGLTDTVTQLAGAVLDTTSSLLSPVITPPDQPILDIPEILPAPADGSSNPGSATPDRSDAVVEAAPVVAPAPPVAPPLAPVVEVAPVLAAVKPAAVVPPAAPVVAKNADGNAAEHANRGDSDPQPVKAPAPNSPGSTASSAHDSFGGARGTHGVLTTQATLHPADAGFTSRSRAVSAAGRAAGLPACSPD